MVILALALLVVSLVLVYSLFPWLVGKWSRSALEENCISHRTIVLTFDDGPGNRLTPQILDLLTQYGVKATFFLLGRNIAGREQIVRRIREQGHDVCSHGFDHLHAWKVWPWQAVADIKKGWQAIDTALGTKAGPYPFRPPYGKLNLATLLYLWGKRVPIVFWSADIGDTWSRGKRESLRDQEWEKIRKGAVILAHDFDRTTDHIDAYVLESVDQVLSIAKEAQLTVRLLSELGVPEKR